MCFARLIAIGDCWLKVLGYWLLAFPSTLKVRASERM